MNKMYNNCLINLSEERFYFHSFVLNGKLYVLVSDKDDFMPIVRGFDPLMILEVNEKEFLVSWRCDDNKFKFQHLAFDGDKKKVIVKYEKDYNTNKGEVKFKNNSVIIEEENNVTIYNYKSNNCLTLDNVQIINTFNLEDYDGVLGKINVRNDESIIFNIDSEKLDVDKFYSVMQDRFINVYKDRNLDLGLRFLVTLENEVYPYLESVESFEEYMRDKKINRACKKLVKNNK